MGKTKALRWHEVHKTVIPGVMARINYTKYTGGTTRVSGYLVDAKYLVRLDLDIKAVLMAAAESEIKICVRNVIGRMVDKYRKTTDIKKASVELHDAPYTQAYNRMRHRL